MRKRRLTDSCLLATCFRQGPVKASPRSIPSWWISPRVTPISARVTMIVDGVARDVDVSSGPEYDGDGHRRLVIVGPGNVPTRVELADLSFAVP